MSRKPNATFPETVAFRVQEARRCGVARQLVARDFARPSQGVFGASTSRLSGFPETVFICASCTAGMDGQCGSGAFKEWLHGLSPEEFALLNGADDPETDELSSRAREREQANVRSGLTWQELPMDFLPHLPAGDRRLAWVLEQDPEYSDVIHKLSERTMQRARQLGFRR